jgi:hypothetical protein
MVFFLFLVGFPVIQAHSVGVFHPLQLEGDDADDRGDDGDDNASEGSGDSATALRDS